MRSTISIFGMLLLSIPAHAFAPVIESKCLRTSRLFMSSTLDSDRATKARKLLDEYLMVEPNEGIKQPPPLDEDLPDTFWSNGHLQQGAGDYVTRWARGVKVAEPLVRYDPIAAEKLLFRQPAKVSE
mmetsp:Transcript_15314/g.23326  ORF Transcript_15314/g.23326 Transcript_15314/m.23326 type:complete len:127 (+) Transcript_15314:50-430(+)